MPVWLVGVRLGLADDSPGYPMRSGDVSTKADVEAIKAARAGNKAGQGGRMGRLDPSRVKPKLNDRGQMVDTGRVLTGEAAR